MAALLRQGARRIGGSVLQRTQAAVSSPSVAVGRRLVPRRMTTDSRSSEQEVQQKIEELYEALSKVGGWGNRRLREHLAVRVKPKPQDKQWHRLRASRWAFNVVRAVQQVSFAGGVAMCLDVLGRKALAK